MWETLMSGNWEMFIDSLYRYANGDMRGLCFEDCKIIVKYFLNKCVEKKNSFSPDNDDAFDFWFSLAYVGEAYMNPIAFLFENRIRVIGKYFEDSIKTSDWLINPKKRREVISYIEDFIQDKPEGYKIALENLKVLKSMDKNEKREREKADRESSSLNNEGILTKVSGFFKKKDVDKHTRADAEGEEDDLI